MRFLKDNVDFDSIQHWAEVNGYDLHGHPG